MQTAGLPKYQPDIFAPAFLRPEINVNVLPVAANASICLLLQQISYNFI